MKLSSKPNGMSTTSESLLDVSDNLSEIFSEDVVLKSIDALEVRIYRVFTELEQKLQECEKDLLNSVRKTIDEIRVDNIESMEAVQLDLEFLRQRVLCHGLDLQAEDPCGFINELSTSTIIQSQIDCDAAQISQFISERVKIGFKLPSSCLKMQEAEPRSALGECLLFELPEERETPKQVEEALKESNINLTEEAPRHGTRSTPRSKSTKMIIETAPEPRYGLPMRFFFASAYAVTISVLVHQVLVRFASK